MLQLKLSNCLYTNWDVLSARQMVESVTRARKSFEEIHSRCLPCINQRKRLQEVEERFRSLKETIISLFEQEERMRMDHEAPKHDHEISVKVRSHKAVLCPLRHHLVRKRS